jgi:pimeloyl-ACP methyl ester carboxylesterase
MCNSKQILRLGPLQRVLWAMAVIVLTTTGARSDIIKKTDMLQGFTTTRAQYAATPHTLWLTVDHRDFCVRYYLSTAGGEGVRPVIFLQGDYLGKLGPNHTWLDPSGTEDVNTDDLMKMADAFSKMAKTTAIYLARIGVDGTSGNHVFRKSLLELHLMNAALDAIKQRHGFQGFHLAGQSGGSMLAGGLLAMRQDVVCAVFGSGPMSRPWRGTPTDPAQAYFDVSERIPVLASKSSTRLLVVTDSADSKVPVKEQKGFVDRMREVGRQVPQYFVEATDDHHHGVVAYTQLVTAGCVLGKSDRDIATAVATIVERNAEFKELRRKEVGALAKNAIATRQPVAGLQVAPGSRTVGNRL